MELVTSCRGGNIYTGKFNAGVIAGFGIELVDDELYIGDLKITSGMALENFIVGVTVYTLDISKQIRFCGFGKLYYQGQVYWGTFNHVSDLGTIISNLNSSDNQLWTSNTFYFTSTDSAYCSMPLKIRAFYYYI